MDFDTIFRRELTQAEINNIHAKRYEEVKKITDANWERTFNKTYGDADIIRCIMNDIISLYMFAPFCVETFANDYWKEWLDMEERCRVPIAERFVREKYHCDDIRVSLNKDNLEEILVWYIPGHPFQTISMNIMDVQRKFNGGVLY